MAVEHVPGRHAAHKIMLYALSTCGWCKRTKKLLDDLGVEYDFIDVDTVPPEKKQEVTREVEKWNPRCSYPTVVIDEKKCIVGFQEMEIREAVK
jgi:glutaredoxin-like protein NrdH